MNRIEALRTKLDELLAQSPNERERSAGRVHLYGVAQFCALLAMKRGESVELAVMAGMLHDIHALIHGDRREHARKGAVLARELLTSLELTSQEETERICDAIRRHSDKETEHNGLADVVVDADVLQHCLINPTRKMQPNEKARYERLKREFGLNPPD